MRSIGYGVYGYQPLGMLTDQQLSIIGKCPNTQMKCDDGQGNDLWQMLPPHFTEEMKGVIGRCPDTSMPCNYNDPTRGQIDLWVEAKQGGSTGLPPIPGADPMAVVASPTAAPSAMPPAPSPVALDTGPILAPDLQIPETTSPSAAPVVILGLIAVVAGGALLYFTSKPKKKSNATPAAARKRKRKKR